MENIAICVFFSIKYGDSVVLVALTAASNQILLTLSGKSADLQFLYFSPMVSQYLLFSILRNGRQRL